MWKQYDPKDQLEHDQYKINLLIVQEYRKFWIWKGETIPSIATLRSDLTIDFASPAFKNRIQTSQQRFQMGNWAACYIRRQADQGNFAHSTVDIVSIISSKEYNVFYQFSPQYTKRK